MKHGRNAIVTGGGTGIGLATTRLLATRGWQITALGLEKDADFPDDARFAECDVSHPEDLASALEGVDQLSGLVTCAGIIRFDRE